MTTARAGLLLLSPGDASPSSSSSSTSSSSSSSFDSRLHPRPLSHHNTALRRRRLPSASTAASTSTATTATFLPCRRRRASSVAAAAASSSSSSSSLSSRACDLYDVSYTLTPYATAWNWQKALLSARLQSLSSSSSNDEDEDDDDDAAFKVGVRDCLLLVQHPPVVTLGTGSTPDNLKFDPDAPDAPFPVHRTERGGEATYHGPGQLVLYPIINLQVRACCRQHALKVFR